MTSARQAACFLLRKTPRGHASRLCKVTGTLAVLLTRWPRGIYIRHCEPAPHLFAHLHRMLAERRAAIARFAPSRASGFRSWSLKILQSKRAKTSDPITRGFRLANPTPTCNRFLSGVVSFDFSSRHNPLRVQRHGAGHGKAGISFLERSRLA